MEIDKWIDGYKVRIFPWIDGKHIYVNVQYYRPGTSVNAPPALDKSALVKADETGGLVVREYIHSLVRHVSRLPACEEMPILTFTRPAR